MNEQSSFNLQLNAYDSNTTENYYPVTSAIAIRDEEIQMTIVNDRSQGGTSLRNGTIEIMQSRRMEGDDGKGMAEALAEYIDYGQG